MGMLFGPSQVGSSEFNSTFEKARLVITVGDRVTDTLAELGRVPDIQVVDRREKRVPREAPKARFRTEYKVNNPAGTITDEAVEGLRRALAGSLPARVSVEGEEDLLAIPAMVLAREGAALFYGQPNEGVVFIMVDESTKRRARALMSELGFKEFS
jgi:uncharacterized protein (UPF0218 family)